MYVFIILITYMGFVYLHCVLYAALEHIFLDWNSNRVRFFGRLVDWLEHLISKRGAFGSNPNREEIL